MKKRMVIAAIAAVAIIAGYLLLRQEKPERYAVPVEKITLAAYAGDIGALVYAAKEQGYFAKNGLDVTIYSDDSWIYQYVNELSSIKNDIYFWLHKNKSFSGRTININDDGTRRTWNPDYSSLDHAGKIFVFGGSTCLGTGARDFYTIPSFISKYLHNGGYKYKVYNYGQSAFTFKQELFYLIYLLRDGFHPDIVIFYDGINDIYSTYQSGKVVVNQNYETVNEKIRFNHNIFNYVKSSFELFLKNYIWNSKIITAFNKIRRNIKKDDETSLQVHSKFSDTEIKILSREIINEYLRSLELLDKISKLYNFKYLNFWQPSLFTEKVIFEEEDKDGFGQIRSHDNSCKKLFVNCQRLVEQKFYGKIVDISQVFDQRDKPYYLDVLHVTEEANSIIADSIYQELISREIVSFSD